MVKTEARNIAAVVTGIGTLVLAVHVLEQPEPVGVEKNMAVGKVERCSVRKTAPVDSRSGCEDFVIQDSHRGWSGRK